MSKKLRNLEVIKEGEHYKVLCDGRNHFIRYGDGSIRPGDECFCTLVKKAEETEGFLSVGL